METIVLVLVPVDVTVEVATEVLTDWLELVPVCLEVAVPTQAC